mmetsp:Transcript_14267/g.39635  ORF Transcript_14267/g.39635 Transcript_14267/m.39635 type:complete len:100 (+) Transcript_14267:134-433(+)
MKSDTQSPIAHTTLLSSHWNPSQLQGHTQVSNANARLLPLPETTLSRPIPDHRDFPTHNAWLAALLQDAIDVIDGMDDDFEPTGGDAHQNNPTSDRGQQ